MEHLIAVTFASHVSAEDVASWVTAFGACGVVRVNSENDRRCLITVRRSGAMEYLETLLTRGEKLGVLAWQARQPPQASGGGRGGRQ
jgi:hypothetical protein